jgi:hypothetical protein
LTILCIFDAVTTRRRGRHAVKTNGVRGTQKGDGGKKGDGVRATKKGDGGPSY